MLIPTTLVNRATTLYNCVIHHVQSEIVSLKYGVVRTLLMIVHLKELIVLREIVLLLMDNEYNQITHH